jgi:hypothetical protein
VERRTLEPARAALRDNVPHRVRHHAAQVLTFGFVALAWVPFFLPPWIDVEACWRILLRMVFLG